LGNSIVFYYCCKFCHGYTREYTCTFIDKQYPRTLQKAFSRLGQTPVLRVKYLHPRYIIIYFFSNGKRSRSSCLQVSVFIVAYWLLFYIMNLLIQFNVCVVGNSHIVNIIISSYHRLICKFEKSICIIA